MYQFLLSEADSYYPFFLLVFSVPWLTFWDRWKNPCKTDESITLFYNTIQRLVLSWVGWINFLLSSLFSREKCIFDLAFCSLHCTSGETTSLITLILITFNWITLLVGLLRLVCLLDGRYLNIHHDQWSTAECRYTFSDEICSSTIFVCLFHKSSNQFVISTSYPFFFFRLLY